MSAQTKPQARLPRRYYRRTPVLPTLPTREDLLLWLRDDQLSPEQRPDKFGLDSATEEENAEAVDPISFWLAGMYGLKDVQTDGWYIYRGRLRDNTVLIFDVHSHPPCEAVIKTVRMTGDAMAAEGVWTDNRWIVTRNELIAILEGWENPYDTAADLARARRLASSGTDGRSFGEC